MSEVLINGIRYVPAREVDVQQISFSQLIVQARKRKNETIQESANRIGTTKSHLWTLENGGCHPRLPLLQKILNYYDLKFDEIALNND